MYKNTIKVQFHSEGVNYFKLEGLIHEVSTRQELFKTMYWPTMSSSVPHTHIWLLLFTSLSKQVLSLFSEELWNEMKQNNEVKGKQRLEGGDEVAPATVSVGTRCWLWLKEEALWLNTSAPLHHEHYPLSNQRSPASKSAHYSPSYPNFLIWLRLDGGFLSSCTPTPSQNHASIELYSACCPSTTYRSTFVSELFNKSLFICFIFSAWVHQMRGNLEQRTLIFLSWFSHFTSTDQHKLFFRLANFGTYFIQCHNVMAFMFGLITDPLGPWSSPEKCLWNRMTKVKY